MKRCSFHHSLREYLYQRAFLRSLGTFNQSPETFNQSSETFNFVDISLINSGKFPFSISEGLVHYSRQTSLTCLQKLNSS